MTPALDLRQMAWWSSAVEAQASSQPASLPPNSRSSRTLLLLRGRAQKPYPYGSPSDIKRKNGRWKVKAEKKHR